MNRYARLFLLALSFFLAQAAQADSTPTMGWSSWNTYRVHISDSLIRRQADAMAALGLREAGYTYINIDDGFFGGREAGGRLRVHPVRFPNGLRPVVEHIHALGFKAGIYSDAGRNTCGHFWDNDSLATGVGLYGHDRADAEFYFCDMGFDFFKVDFCGGDATQNSEGLSLDERERYTAIRRTIDSTGRRDVRVNICRWAFPGTWASEVGSSWRIAADISPDWAAVRRIIAANRYLSAYATGGSFNDMDMLEVGRGLTEAEERTHFGMWCIQSSPLLIGCDLTTIPAASLRLITNPELIALNQDALGLQAYVVRADSGVFLYVKDIETLHGTVRAVAVYNSTDEPRTMCIDLAELDLAGRTKVRDLFARHDLPAVEQGRMEVSVPGRDTRIFRLEAERRTERTVYEAETAWLNRFQQLGLNPRLGHATYEDDSACSGGAKVCWLGLDADNYLEWRDVWSRAGGEYELTLYGLADEPRTCLLSVNGETPVRLSFPATGSLPVAVPVRVHLRKGSNRVRLFNAEGWCPDIDRMTLQKK